MRLTVYQSISCKLQYDKEHLVSIGTAIYQVLVIKSDYTFCFPGNLQSPGTVSFNSNLGSH